MYNCCYKDFNSEIMYDEKIFKIRKNIQHKRILSMFLYVNNIVWFSL